MRAIRCTVDYVKLTLVAYAEYLHTHLSYGVHL